MKACRKQ